MKDERTNTGAIAAPSAVHLIARRFEVAIQNGVEPVEFCARGLSEAELTRLLAWTSQRMVDYAAVSDFAWLYEDIAGWVAVDLFGEEDYARAWPICALAKWPGDGQPGYTSRGEFFALIFKRWPFPHGPITLEPMTLDPHPSRSGGFVNFLQLLLAKAKDEGDDTDQVSNAMRHEIAAIEEHGVASWMAGQTYSEGDGAPKLGSTDE